MTNPSSSIFPIRLTTRFALTAIALALTACGGGGDNDSNSNITLSGSVSGLTGDGLILSDNGTTLSVAAGATSFSFGTVSGSYDVTILAQPTNGTCSVVNGSGGSSNSVSSIQVQCRAYGVFVANQTGNSIAQFSIGSDGTLKAVAPATVVADGAVTSLAASGDGQHAWANFSDSKSIANLVIGSDGTLSTQSTYAQAASAGSSDSPLALAVSPDNKTLYAANYGDASISVIGIGSNGLATVPGAPMAPVASGVNPFALAVTADGTRLYATNQSDDTISGYDIGTGGGLTPLATAATSTTGQGTSPEGIVANPNSATVYVTLADSAKLVAYSINPGTGVLTVKTSIATGTSPHGLAVTPAGTFLYVTNYGAATVSEYSLAGGVLTSLGSVAAGSHPNGVSISPDGKFAYVTNNADATISQYSIGASGVLTPLSPATVPSGGLGPVGIIVR